MTDTGRRLRIRAARRMKVLQASGPLNQQSEQRRSEIQTFQKDRRAG